ncbi:MULTISPECIES: peptidoglycan DD-metalloendopeptidase family protein [unclassified Halomonas]|uniref:peptidoglycan DD-metalloendopeptidase family protein n=1 Tax=unclassified Halomonas TaxID=2609666 RepID=UPI0007D99AA6|nr:MULTISPECIES: peptidoglycan DD-metalloendopeptidase family protein [unclassified Halomonas]MBT2785098.1 peptidoglycan DD-metalloendopeptidase family protein [Halomonas sp. ISL-106]MBT2796792.1 peptidoglycan DD-metalloendopeptidase family protein [Halomonas sp. ISL-104]OAL60020.1 peptidase M23 [Halomonas sp. ALS9]
MCKGYLPKVLMMSALALAIAGCASQQGGSPQVRDLSQARQAVENSPQYTVKAGDTLYGIAWQHNLDYRQLAAMNNINPPYQIRPGQTIALREGAASVASSNQPATSASGGSSAVARGLSPQTASVASDDQELDWLLPDESAIQRNQRLTAERNAADQDASSSTPQPEVVAAADPEPAQQPTPQRSPEPEQAPEPQPVSEPEPKPEPKPEPQPEAAPAQQSASVDRSSRTYTPAETIAWQWPANGNVVGAFGQGNSITAGIDIAGEKGQPVKAAGPGIVVYAGSGVRGYGNLILLKHNDQFLSAYAHNDSLRVSENDVVEAGEVIATMGDSDAENVRLHFEVRRDGQPQDPMDFLPSR